MKNRWQTPNKFTMSSLIIFHLGAYSIWILTWHNQPNTRQSTDKRLTFTPSVCILLCHHNQLHNAIWNPKIVMQGYGKLFLIHYIIVLFFHSWSYKKYRFHNSVARVSHILYHFHQIVQRSKGLHVFLHPFNSSPPEHNGCQFGRQQFQMHFFNVNDRIPIRISLKFVPRSPIENKPALLQPELMQTHFTDTYMRH